MTVVDSIHWGLGLNVLAACCLLALSLLAPFLHYGIDRVQTVLGRLPESPFADRGLSTFQKLGWRAIALTGLVSLGIASGIYVIAAELPGMHLPMPSNIFAAATLVAGWLLLLWALRWIHFYGTVLRALLIVPVAKRLARQLSDNWPTSDGTLPWIGRFSVSAETPNILQVEDFYSQFPLWECCGPFVRRDPAGIIRFDLASRPDVYLALEVFFNKGQPSSYTDHLDGFNINRKLAGNAAIGKNLYLATYESEFADIDEKGVEVIGGVMQHLASEIAKNGNGQGCKLCQSGKSDECQ